MAEEAEENRDEVASQLLKAPSVGGKSTFTQKTYIQSLEAQLNDEKIARLVLESEIDEIKKINAEISSKLALTSSASEIQK